MKIDIWIKRLLTLTISLLVIGLTAVTMIKTPFSFNEKIVAGIAQPLVTTEDTHQYFRENIIFADQLRSLKLFLDKMVGYVEIDNVFITDDGLIPRYTPSNSDIYIANTTAIKNYALASAGHTAVMILPSSSAIYQDKLPAYATQTLTNEKLFIEEVNKEFSGCAMAVNSYPIFFGNRHEYLYFKTHNTITMTGGYIAYSALIERLGLVPVDENAFKIQYVNSDFYGDVAGKLGNNYDISDRVSQYHYIEENTLYSVEHWQRYASKEYSSLYPNGSFNVLNPKNTILGGMSPRIDITSYTTDGNQKLLVIGDENALSVIPFLTLHYGEITFVSPNLLTAGEMEKILSSDYSLTLFITSIESYTNINWASKINAITLSIPRLLG